MARLADVSAPSPVPAWSVPTGSGPTGSGPAAAGPAASTGVQDPTLEVAVQQVDPGLALPGYAHPGDAGADLCTTEDVVLAPGERRLVGTGVALALPDGYAGFVHPRSGLAARHGLSIVNAPGTVDAGYRGEIEVCLVNTDQHTPIELRRGDRIAQLVVQQVVHVQFVAVDTLPASVRGAGGHGSTGGFAGSPGERHS